MLTPMHMSPKINTLIISMINISSSAEDKSWIRALFISNSSVAVVLSVVKTTTVSLGGVVVEAVNVVDFNSQASAGR